MALASGVGHEPLLHAGQEDGVELQPLGRVERHEEDGRLAGRAVHVGQQGDAVQEAGQARALFPGLVVRGRGQELGQVLEAVLALLGRLLGEGGGVPGGLQGPGEEALHPEPRGVLAQTRDHLAEAVQGLDGPAGEQALVLHDRQRLPR